MSTLKAPAIETANRLHRPITRHLTGCRTDYTQSTGTINDSYLLSSIVDAATGYYYTMFEAFFQNNRWLGMCSNSADTNSTTSDDAIFANGTPSDSPYTVAMCENVSCYARSTAMGFLDTPSSCVNATGEFS